MIAAVVKEEQSDDPPDERWLDEAILPVRAGVQSANAGKVLPIIGRNPAMIRSDFTSDVDFEIYQFRHVMAEHEPAIFHEELEPALGASVKSDGGIDDRDLLQMWLAHAGPAGYTSLIKTRSPLDPDLDVLEVHGQVYDAPQRMRHVVIPQGKGKKPIHELRRDKCAVNENEELMVKQIIRWYPSRVPGKPNPRNRSVYLPKTMRSGLTGLRSKWDCSSVFIGQCTPLNLARAKKKHGDRSNESKASRKRFGKEDYRPPAVGNDYLVRRVPGADEIIRTYDHAGRPTIRNGAVMWFLKHPDGKGAIFDEVWETSGTVGVDADEERTERQRLAEYANDLKAHEYGYMRPEDVYGQDELLSVVDEDLYEDADELEEVEDTGTSVWRSRVMHGPVVRPTKAQIEKSRRSYIDRHSEYVDRTPATGESVSDEVTSPIPKEGEYIPAAEGDPEYIQRLVPEDNLKKMLNNIVPRMLQSREMVPAYDMSEQVKVTVMNLTLPVASEVTLDVLSDLIKKTNAQHDELMQAWIRCRAVQGWPESGVDWGTMDFNVDGVLDDNEGDMVVSRVDDDGKPVGFSGFTEVDVIAEGLAQRRPLIAQAKADALLIQQWRDWDRHRRFVNSSVFRIETRTLQRWGQRGRSRAYLRLHRENQFRNAVATGRTVMRDAIPEERAALHRMAARSRKLTRKLMKARNVGQFKWKVRGYLARVVNSISQILPSRETPGMETPSPINIPKVSAPPEDKRPITPRVDPYHNERGRKVQYEDLYPSEENKILIPTDHEVDNVIRMHGTVGTVKHLIQGDYTSRTGDLIKAFHMQFRERESPFLLPPDEAVIVPTNVPLVSAVEDNRAQAQAEQTPLTKGAARRIKDRRSRRQAAG